MKTNSSAAYRIKKDFPIFKNNKNLIYLDSASTSQRPKIVIDAVTYFQEHENANVNRGIYTLSEKATDNFNKARETIAKFINASPGEIIITKNTTESINLLAYTIKSLIKKGKNEIVLTEMEHHSNLVPWQEFARKNKLKLKFIEVKDDFTLDYHQAKKIIGHKTALVALTHASNVLGTVNDIKKIISYAKKHSALTVIDAAQSITHLPINVKKIDCDFLAFSSHKIFGPTGVGILYGKYSLLKKLTPFQYGGGMIKKVTKTHATWTNPPEKFEAGTINAAEVIGLAKAIEWLKKANNNEIKLYQKNLLNYTLNELKKIKGVKLFHPSRGPAIGVISFTIDGIHPHDVASVIDNYGIALRAGHHCAMPLMEKLKTPGTIRISLSLYNTKEDINKLIIAINKTKEVFKIK